MYMPSECSQFVRSNIILLSWVLSTASLWNLARADTTCAYNFQNFLQIMFVLGFSFPPLPARYFLSVFRVLPRCLLGVPACPRASWVLPGCLPGLPGCLLGAFWVLLGTSWVSSVATLCLLGDS